MTFTERYRIITDRIRKKLRQKRQKAWSGITILIVRDDHADLPTGIRINYYILFFALITITALATAGIAFRIRSEITTLPEGERLSSRRILFQNIRSASTEKETLMHRSEDQILNFQRVFDASEPVRFRTSKAFFDSLMGNESVAVDTVSQDLEKLRYLRRNAEGLLDFHSMASLNRVWNRLFIYHVTPRGRPLPPGIGVITSGYGNRQNPFDSRDTGSFHSGLDLAAAPGAPIIATAAGQVIFANTLGNSGYGLYVKIHHGLGYVTLYSHNSKNIVSGGDFVSKGQVISLMGKTGSATGNHVHYEVLLGHMNHYDPMEYIAIK